MNCTTCRHYESFAKLPHDPYPCGCRASGWEGYIADPAKPECGGVAYSPSVLQRILPRRKGSHCYCSDGGIYVASVECGCCGAQVGEACRHAPAPRPSEAPAPEEGAKISPVVEVVRKTTHSEEP
jgi:hypothetical protein